MIQYSPGYWSIWFSFASRGSVLPKAFCIAIPCIICTTVLHYWLRNTGYKWLDLPKPKEEDGLLKTNEFGSPVISQFMFVLGFLVVFRANQAYARWWEGGSLLLKVRGDWFNAFSSSVALCSDKPEVAADVIEFQHRLLRLFSLLFGTALVQIRQMKDPAIEILGLQDFDQEHMRHLQVVHDKSELVLQWIQKLVVQAQNEGILAAPAPVVARVFNQLGVGMTSLSTVRKIAEFPIPFPVAQLITLMLVFHWILTSLICAVCVQNQYWAGFLSSLVVTAFWGINYIAVELEMPFGDDCNDLPLEEMQRDMNSSLLSLIHPKSTSVPGFGISFQEEDGVESSEVIVKIAKEILSYADDGRMVWDPLPEMHNTQSAGHHAHRRINIGRTATHARGAHQSMKMHSHNLGALSAAFSHLRVPKALTRRDPDPDLDCSKGDGNGEDDQVIEVVPLEGERKLLSRQNSGVSSKAEAATDVQELMRWSSCFYEQLSNIISQLREISEIASSYRNDIRKNTSLAI